LRRLVAAGVRRLGIARDDIDLILIRIFPRPDHFGGLPFLLSTRSSRGGRVHWLSPTGGIETRLTTGDGSAVRRIHPNQQRIDLSVIVSSRGDARIRRGKCTRFRWCTANPAGRFLAYRVEAKAASSLHAPTPNGRRR